MQYYLLFRELFRQARGEGMLAFIIPSVERVGIFQDILHWQSKYYFSGKVSISSQKMGCFRLENLA